MRVGVGYSENPHTVIAAKEAVKEAFEQAARLHGKAVSAPCSMVLMFSTVQHNAELLRASVAAKVGEGVPIIGGGAVGVISNTRFGYAGDQMIVALIWLENTSCSLLTQNNLIDGEFGAGLALGEKLVLSGAAPDSPVLLFYDAIDETREKARLAMATPLLEGMEKSLGFLPNLIGAGLMSDYILSPYSQWTGNGISQHSALAMLFSGEASLNSTIMHGCEPATGYYTVTRSDAQTILEINNEPALPFIKKLLKNEIPAENFPFNLIFGVNRGERWDDFEEEKYASRLCLDIDYERNGIVMFEPDMVAGTEFQVMYRSLFLDYMRPRIEALFKQIEGRRPALALYIDCAGRAAGFAGMDLEDALVVQECVPASVPLLGLYAGVEIGQVKGKPQGLDWTGVFCLFSVPYER